MSVPPKGHPFRRFMSVPDRLLQDVVEEPFGSIVAGSPFCAERRLPLHLSQCGKKRAIHFLCASPFHLGFDSEPIIRFSDRAFRSQLLKSTPDNLL